MARTVRMSVTLDKGTLITQAICPIHGVKYLTSITQTQLLSANQKYRKAAERLFLARSGEKEVNFIWFKEDFFLAETILCFLRYILSIHGKNGLNNAIQQIDLFVQGVRDVRMSDETLVILSKNVREA